MSPELQRRPAVRGGGPDGEAAPVMHDVARLAGVSHMTVSRVLNEPWRVRPATRERVLSAIGELGYRPNSAARSLATRRSRTIGVIALHTTLYGPSSTLHGIEEAARAADYYVSVASAPRSTTEALRESAHRLLAQSVDGVVIIAPVRWSARVVEEIGGSTLVVAVEAAGLAGVPSVGVDQGLGARRAVEHLLGLGHATVHHVAGPVDWNESERRAEGWREALRAARRRIPSLVSGDWTARSGYEATRSLLSSASRSRPMTALFVANDHMALGALRALHEGGLRVPEDVSVVGFDDLPEAAYFTPPLTTVRQEVDVLGGAHVHGVLPARVLG